MGFGGCGVAFVLSFAMVCTLLAGVNVVAFAADDNDLIVSVHCFYNDALKGGDGEHLYTKDVEEMSWLSSLPTWNDENEAWKAPVSSSLAVYRVYNPNSGEHHYAAADEAEWLVSQGWTQEKIAFYSDDNKGVAIYRLWNGGEGVGSHYYTTDEGEKDFLVAAYGWKFEGVNFYGVKEEEPGKIEGVVIDNMSPKVGDTITATPVPVDAENIAGYTWLVNGVPTLDDDNTILVDDSFKSGDAIVCVVTDTEGNEFTSNVATVAVTYAVLVDKSGLQTDGNGYVGDILAVTYTPELGNPQQVTWYKDGTAILTKNAQTAGGLDFTLTNTAGQSLAIEQGNYMATITTGDGKNFNSNPIYLSETELEAAISDASISDYTAEYDYDATNTKPKFQTFATKDERSVITFTVNKDYAAQAYAYSVTDKTFATKLQTWDLNNVASVVSVPSPAQLTDKNAIEKSGLVAGTAGVAGIKYTATDGKTTYKLVTNAAETGKVAWAERGKDYVIVLDQDNITSDDPANKKVNKTEDMTIPYLPAPKAVECTGTNTATGAILTSLTLYTDEEMTTPMAFLGNANNKVTPAAAGLTTTAYTVTGSDYDTGKATMAATAATGYEGLNAGSDGLWAEPALAGKTCVWGQVKTDEGIYGPKSVTIKSDLASLPAESMTAMKMTYNPMTAPEDLKVEFTGLKTAGTVLVARTKASDIADIQTNTMGLLKGTTTPVGMASVEKNASSVTLEDVVDDIHETANRSAGDYYTAVFVPADTETFSVKSTVTTPTNVTPFATSMYYNGDGISGTSSNNWGAAGGTLTITGFTAVDQFGVDMVAANTVARTATVEPINNTAAHTESATAKWTNGATGKAQLVLTNAQTAGFGIDPYDGFNVTVGTTTITLVNQRGTVEGGAMLPANWKAYINGTEVSVSGVAPATATLTSIEGSDQITIATDNTQKDGTTAAFSGVDQYGNQIAFTAVADTAMTTTATTTATVKLEVVAAGTAKITTKAGTDLGYVGQTFTLLDNTNKVTWVAQCTGITPGTTTPTNTAGSIWTIKAVRN